MPDSLIARLRLLNSLVFKAPHVKQPDLSEFHKRAHQNCLRFPPNYLVFQVWRVKQPELPEFPCMAANLRSVPELPKGHLQCRCCHVGYIFINFCIGGQHVKWICTAWFNSFVLSLPCASLHSLNACACACANDSNTCSLHGLAAFSQVKNTSVLR